MRLKLANLTPDFLIQSRAKVFTSFWLTDFLQMEIKLKQIISQVYSSWSALITGLWKLCSEQFSKDDSRGVIIEEWFSVILERWFSRSDSWGVILRVWFSRTNSRGVILVIWVIRASLVVISISAIAFTLPKVSFIISVEGFRSQTQQLQHRPLTDDSAQSDTVEARESVAKCKTILNRLAPFY